MLLHWFDILAAYVGEEGEGEGEGLGTGEGEGEGEGEGQGAGNSQPNSLFDENQQKELNRILAEEKRKLRQKYEEPYKSLETDYQNLLQDKTLSDEKRGDYEKKLEEIQARQRTKEQQILHDKKLAEEGFQSRIGELEESAKTWEQRYTESSINRELQAAAVNNDAYNPEQIVVQLKSQTALVEQLDAHGKPTGNLVPMVNMMVKNEDSGATEMLQMTPDEAVEHMKKNPERWGNFFKNNIREGIGSTSATGGAMTGDGTVDVTRLSDEQYFELRKKNPRALGLDHLDR